MGKYWGIFSVVYYTLIKIIEILDGIVNNDYYKKKTMIN